MEDNGRVRFGPAAGNSIPAEWAPLVLQKLFARYQQAVGAALAEVAAEQLAGVRIKATKPRADQ
jgi:hypothetical protein